ncbi:MAG TPA: nucleoside-diphosphate sugar epimerase/dehydratase [Pseudonocardiaceae bacterium]
MYPFAYRRWQRTIRSSGILLLDGTAWVVALGTASWLRYDWDTAQIDVAGTLHIAAVAVLAQWVLGAVIGSYRGRYYLGSVEQACNLALVAVAVGAVQFGYQFSQPQPIVPRSVPLIATLIMLALSVAARLVLRLRVERPARSVVTGSRRVIVFGAGDAGRQLVRSMRLDPASGYRPVALLDDDPDLRRRRIAGVRVRGGRADLADVAAETTAELLVIAVPSVDPLVRKELARKATDAGLGVKVLPPLAELFRPRVGASDLRDMNFRDLLGRQPVDTDVAAIAGYLRGKRVLVTGAGGSIGSELCRQIHRFEPAELMMLDRDESALHAVELSIRGRALLDSRDLVLADIRDACTVHRLFMSRRPEVVFHAAALKHLPMLQQYPEEAWKTNVLGTQHVLDAALACGVERFVNISTDKAANPVSVLGRSKRIGELLVASSSPGSHGAFLSVRFGNVLGSRGSVLTTFAEQIAAGRPLTITHPDVSRFFMMIPEAVELVIQAAAIGSCGEALVLDMGSPVRIVDVARQLMEIARSFTPIVYTGLRDGEKLHEELFGAGERDVRPLHPAISHVEVPALEADELRMLSAVTDPVAAMVELTSPDMAGLASLRPAGTAGGRQRRTPVLVAADKGAERGHETAPPASGSPEPQERSVASVADRLHLSVLQDPIDSR